MPSEIPLEPGESPPIFRRRVGTAYQLPQNLINSLNNKEESITQLELEKQVQANMAEAALGLANDPHISKVGCCPQGDFFFIGVTRSYLMGV